MKDIDVAAVVMRSVLGDVRRNLRRTAALARRAAEQGADIACFPEASLTGYHVRGDLAGIAQTIPGEVTDAVVGLAKELDMALVVGVLERSGGAKAYVSQVAAGPEGILAIYRKTHLATRECEAFQPGSETPVFSWRGTRFGMQLCYDGHFPELTTRLALLGAEVVLTPHASPGPETRSEKRRRWMRYLPARAYDSSVFVVACNQTGDNGAGLCFPGVALILDPKGTLLAGATAARDRVVTTRLSGEALARIKSSNTGFFLGSRRPELYHESTIEPGR